MSSGMSLYGRDSGLVSDLTDENSKETGQSRVTPDTGIGREITRLSAPKKHFDFLFEESDSSSTAYQTGHSRTNPVLSSLGKAAPERNSLTEVELREMKNLSNPGVELKEEPVGGIGDLSWKVGKETRQSSASHSRSYSLQLDSTSLKDSSLRNSAHNRRASSYAPSRSLSDGPAADIAVNNEMEDRMKARNRNSDGVQLRGDKGNARKKSAVSSASSQGQRLPISDEWTKSFEVPYVPRRKATKIIRATIAPPKIGKLDSEKDLENITRLDSSKNERSWRQSSSRLGKEGLTSASDNDSAGHAEIHYEKYLPKESWLEMKPRKFTHNYKHGNHFELRKLSKSESPATKSNLRKETFIWENPHQIWLMEKTHID